MTIKASDVQALRELTNVGMMDCKKALQETSGDIEKAVIILREKGIAKAAKRAGREAKEGLVYSYIHPGGKLGVLIEVNCETDFVAKNEDFIQLVKDLAMQVAAAAPQYIAKEEVPSEIIDAEMAIAKKQLETEGKPANIIEKIIPGKIAKYHSEICLLEQNSVKDSSVKMGTMFDDFRSKIGEKVVIRRFVRYELGN
ncbi:MAG: translation elongation factor Ts [bacterium]|nr:translation elongation factor Ts [bacterium]